METYFENLQNGRAMPQKTQKPQSYAFLTINHV